MGQQPGPLLGPDPGGRQLIAGRRHPQEVFEQEGHVLLALPQWGDIHPYHIEPVIEVGAKGALIDQLLQIHLAGRQYPYIQRNGVIGAEGLYLSVLQHPQQLDLQRHRHALYLVEKEGAPVCPGNLAYPALLGPGEGAGLEAEQLALHHGFGHGAAVDGDEGLGGAHRMVVQEAGDQLLAAPRFSHDQHVGGGILDVGEELAQPLDGRMGAEQAGSRPALGLQFAAQLPVLQHQAPLVTGSAHHLQQLLSTKRLLDEIVGPQAHGLYRGGDVAVPREQDHRQLGVAAHGFLEQGDAVHAGHVDVADDDAGPLGADVGQGLCGAGEGSDLPLRQLQGLAEGEAQVVFIVDQHDLVHGVLLERTGEAGGTVARARRLMGNASGRAGPRAG